MRLRCMRSVVVAVPAMIAIAFAAVAEPSAYATTAHNPIGHVDSVRAASAHTIAVRGWGYDPDYATTPISVDIYIDGHGTRWHTGVSRPDIASTHPGTGQSTGFSFVSGVLAYGVHKVCTDLVNKGLGATTLLPCYSVRLIDPHNPKGTLTVSRSGRTLTAHGYAFDPDTTNSIMVTYRVDSGSWVKVAAALTTPTAPVAGAHGYSRSWTLPYGTHMICVLALNVGLGSDSTVLGCPKIAIPQPLTVNQEIGAYAKTFVGKYPYVSGGRSPSTGFDCSGLTYYLYHHYGHTLATTAQAQYNQFHRIALSSARPGDLVFFHDSGGYVFHVGLYEGNKMMVAAATPEDGIRYQTVWSSAVTYGTILH